MILFDGKVEVRITLKNIVFHLMTTRIQMEKYVLYLLSGGRPPTRDTYVGIDCLLLFAWTENTTKIN